MLIVEIKTLIDITKPDIPRVGECSDKQQKQLKNWNTFLQCVSLRCNVEFERDPTVETHDIKNMGFGNRFKGTQKIWSMEFIPARDGTGYDDEKGNLIGLLLDDLHQVPIVTNLNETINIHIPVIDLQTEKNRNTLVTYRIVEEQSA